MSYQQIIFNRLRQHGISEAGALGVLGNFQCESGCEPFRLQGDFSPYRTMSKSYVQGVTNGSISRDTFSRDAKGFGIYQLTYWTRKQGYYDFWKQSGKALDDAELQTDYALIEMEADYPQLLAFLRVTTDIFTACSRVCREFERPAVNNIDARFSAAKKYQAELDLNGWQGGESQEEPEPEPTPTPMPAPVVEHKLVLRDTDEHCSGWPEAFLVQALLKCRGFDLHVIDGVWDDEDIDALALFQSEKGLVPDAIAGPLTWAKLLERG